jgi:hypothetical protein
MPDLKSLPLTRRQSWLAKGLNFGLVMVLMQWSPLWPLLCQAFQRHIGVDWSPLTSSQQVMAVLNLYPTILAKPELANALFPDLLVVCAVSCLYLLAASKLGDFVTLRVMTAWLASKQPLSLDSMVSPTSVPALSPDTLS